jgi:hypothetical protein
MSSDAKNEINRRLAELEAEARHASERYRLYRAKVYGPRLTSFRRLRELDRESKLEEGRLPGAGSSAASSRMSPRRG